MGRKVTTNSAKAFCKLHLFITSDWMKVNLVDDNSVVIFNHTYFDLTISLAVEHVLSASVWDAHDAMRCLGKPPNAP